MLRYTYVRNRPLKFIDPTGESATLAGAVISGLFGTVGPLIQGAVSGEMPSRRQVGAAAAGGPWLAR